LWTKYAREAHAIIYVVDATDKTRLPMAAQELKLFIDDSENNHYPTSKNPLLIFANKQVGMDLSLSTETISARTYTAQPAFALSPQSKIYRKWTGQKTWMK